MTVHRLVAMAFIDNPHNLKTVNHKDGNKLNNNIENLEWMDNRDNVQHAWDNGLNEIARSTASEVHGFKCKLINIETNEEISFNSHSQLSLYLGYNRHWLSKGIRDKTNYTNVILNKGYTIELEEVTNWRKVSNE